MASSVDLRGLAIDRSSDGPAVRNRRHVLTRYVLPALLVIGFCSLIAWASWDFFFPPTEVTVTPVISTTAEVQQEGAPLFKAAGWIEPRPTPIRVAALAPGVVSELLVVEDQWVKAGDPVAELVKDDAQLQTEAAQAEFKLREAELEDVAAELRSAATRFEQPVHLQAPLEQAEAMLAKVETQLANLPFELQRAIADETAAHNDYQGKADSQGVVAGVKIDIAKAKWEASKALVAELRGRKASYENEQAALTARRNALKTQLELLTDETQAKEAAAAKVKAAQARVEHARVNVNTAKLRLGRMTISAPVDGRIFRLIAHPGARIGGGMNQMEGYDGSTVVTMYQPSKLQIRVDVRFEDIPKVRLQQPVEIMNPALSKPILGSVLFISSEADIQKNTLQVKVTIPDPPAVFKPEMLVDATFLAPRVGNEQKPVTKEIRLYLPQKLVHTADAGSFVWVADQSLGVARKTSVQTASTGGPLVEIKSGLTMTSRIITSPSSGLRDGRRITIVGEAGGQVEEMIPEGE